MKEFIDTTGARKADPERIPDAVIDTVYTHSLSVNQLVAHERRCVNLLTRAWRLLVELGAQPVALTYEDLYRASTVEQAANALRSTTTIWCSSRGLAA